MPEQHLEKRGQSMAYKLNVTEHAEELLDNLVYHLIYLLKNAQAAKHPRRMCLLYQNVLLSRIWRLMRCLQNDKINKMRVELCR